jgi:hypothetical protein
MFVIYLHTEFYVHSSSVSLVVAVKQKAKDNFIRASVSYFTFYKKT